MLPEVKLRVGRFIHSLDNALNRKERRGFFPKGSDGDHGFLGTRNDIVMLARVASPSARIVVDDVIPQWYVMPRARVMHCSARDAAEIRAGAAGTAGAPK